MKDLIKRIEAADGPDRELDVEICEAMGFTVVGHYRRGSNEPIRGYSWVPVRYYTSSIDAAMTLVPEGWNGSFDWIGDKCGATLNKTPFASNAVIGDASSPALALCAAALRARNG